MLDLMMGHGGKVWALTE